MQLFRRKKKLNKRFIPLLLKYQTALASTEANSAVFMDNLHAHGDFYNV